jgi:ribosome-binding factor A
MSQRTSQVGALMTQEINNIMLRDFEPPRGCLITISHTEPTPDLKHAKVFVSVLPHSMSGTALAALKKQTGHIQYKLNRTLSMRFVPRIQWVYDETNIKLDNIDRALNNVDEPLK